MCLDDIWSEKKKEKWLKNKNDTIILYKTVGKKGEDGRYYPTHKYRDISFNVNNRIGKNSRGKIRSFLCRDKHYRPYYHLFRYKKDALKWFSIFYDVGNLAVLRCEVKKEDITEIGVQILVNRNCDVIVSRAFKIIGEVK